ncbi:MAG: hypothetical protein LBC98_09085 [Prevotellaceae bacterium]|nr:hypothetical protein [Prevotellaceae bacterium]
MPYAIAPHPSGRFCMPYATVPHPSGRPRMIYSTVPNLSAQSCMSYMTVPTAVHILVYAVRDRADSRRLTSVCHTRPSRPQAVASKI